MLNDQTAWPADHRPREKLLTLGAQALSDAELLAIFYRTGVKGKNVVLLAQEHLQQHGNLRQLLALNKDHFKQLTGGSINKYIVLQAAIELAKRYLYTDLQKGEALKSSLEAVNYLKMHLKAYQHEVVVGLMLDAKLRVLKLIELGQGSSHFANIPLRQLLQHCLAAGAQGLILAHNHPSGDATPSEADIETTRKLKQILAWADIRLLDHIIVADSEHSSLANLGVL